MQDKDTNSPIIQTKLYRPSLQADFIPRPQLLEKLDGWQQRLLTLVSAPAGYGKNKLASMWLETYGCSSGWVSLDVCNSNLHTLSNYLLASMLVFGVMIGLIFL